MDPEAVAKWVPVFRDFAIVIVCLGALVYETVFTTPNAVIVGLIGTLLMAPTWIRLDSARRNKRDDDT